MKVVALIVAGGSGVRAGKGLPKQYWPIGGKAVLAHAIDALAAHPRVDVVQVVVGAGQEELYRDATGDRPLLPPVVGGAERQESACNGLQAIERGGGAEIVLIHDAARPFCPPEVIDRLLAALDGNDGAVPVLPIADTVARDDGMLGGVVPREGLVRIQTPQAFRFERILEAHRAWKGPPATDDAQIARAVGIEVALVPGDRALEKLTYATDFGHEAPSLLTHVGLGFDVHAFAPGDGVWLGGVRIAHDRALAGHSDADVALHALTDAILGAIGEGDIGEHFPPGDPRWRDAASHQFLAHARDLVAARGGTIDHVDVTIICEAPRIGPHRDAMKARIAGILEIDAGNVSVKATTTERLGFAGRGEGIAAQAAATVRLPG